MRPLWPDTEPEATWPYTSPDDPKPVALEHVWKRLRYQRDALLAACDWRVVLDAPWDVDQWITYRQALRDLPDVTSDPRLAAWPTPPGEF